MQHPPKFYQELQKLITHNSLSSGRLLPEYDHDTGRFIMRPDADLYIQVLNLVTSCNLTVTPPLFLSPYSKLESNPLYPPNTSPTKDKSLPTKRYYWTIIPHSTMTQYTIGQVYTKDPPLMKCLSNITKSS